MSTGAQAAPVQQTTTTPSPQAQELYNLALPSAQQFAAAPTPTPYPGSTVAPFTPTQETAQSQLISGAGTAGDVADWSRGGVEALPGQMATTAANLTPYTPGAPLQTSSNIFSDPGIWNPNANAGLEAAISAAQRPTWQNLTDTALPAIRSSFGPGPTSTRQGIAEGLAIGRGTQTAADIAQKMAEDEYGANLAAVNQRYNTNIGAEGQRYGQDVSAEQARYGTNVDAQNKLYNSILATYGMAPSLQQQGLVPGATVGAVGDVQQQLQQAQLTDLVNKYNYGQIAPFLKAQEIMSLAQGLPGGTTTSTANVPPNNPGVMQALGGAGAGAALGGALGSVVPGLGTGIGALAGGGIGATLPFLFK